MSSEAGPDEPRLFDLPLAPGPVGEESEPEPPPKPRPRSARPRPPQAESLPLFAPDEEARAVGGEPAATEGTAAVAPLPGEETEPPVASPDASQHAGGRLRLVAGLVDLGVHLVVVLVLFAGTLGMRIEPAPRDAPALLVSLLIFSFLYFAVPLAFWGRTLGMRRTGLVARDAAGGPLTFGQTGRRWLGAVVTVLFLGLPLLPAFFGRRSLADVVSGSRTLVAD